jgi:hypothetical protein
VNIIQAIEDKNLFGTLFRDPRTWRAWGIFARALFGLPIAAGADRALFRECTGLEAPPGARAREAFVVCGRRSGKSFMSAVIASFLAVQDWTRYLGAGERGHVFIIATDKAQASIIKGYVSGIFHSTKTLRSMLRKETGEALELRNAITIMVKTASFRTVRGYTLLACILEEMAFYRSDESANPDKEILAAVRPALATIPESLLLGISTPYSRAGALWDMYRANFGQPGRTLIWKAPTKTMNPTVSDEVIEAAMRDDPEAARAEWLAEWRSDVSQFITLDLLEAVTVPDRKELPPAKGLAYVAFLDPSGGRQDSMTLAIAHLDGRTDRVVVDAAREARPPFAPKSVVEEFAQLLKDYGIREATSDRFGGEWVVEAFRDQGIEVQPAEMTASELYAEALPLITNGAVELLDHQRLRGQFTNLERRTRPGGKDMISHFRGSHDDLANAAAGAMVLASTGAAAGQASIGFVDHDVRPGHGDDDDGFFIPTRIGRRA